jgi:hypothetical protein
VSQRKRIVVAVVLAFAATAAIAEPLPVPKPSGLGGSCPQGYTIVEPSCALTD